MEREIQWAPGVTLDAIEKQVILMAFRFYRGNKTATSNALGIAIRTLDNKLDRYMAENLADIERQNRERKDRTEFLKRQRGGHPATDIGNGETPATDSTPAGADVPKNHTGFRVEPTHKAPEKHAVPVSQRKEVQDVLPADATASGAKRRSS